MVTTLDAATGATRHELMIPGVQGDFGTQSIVSSPAMTAVVYETSTASTNNVRIWSQQVDQTGNAVAAAASIADITAYQSGAASSGVFGGTAVVLDGKTHVLVPTHLRRVDPAAPLDDEFVLHHAVGCDRTP